MLASILYAFPTTWHETVVLLTNYIVPMLTAVLWAIGPYVVYKMVIIVKDFGSEMDQII